MKSARYEEKLKKRWRGKAQDEEKTSPKEKDATAELTISPLSPTFKIPNENDPLDSSPHSSSLISLTKTSGTYDKKESNLPPETSKTNSKQVLEQDAHIPLDSKKTTPPADTSKSNFEYTTIAAEVMESQITGKSPPPVPNLINPRYAARNQERRRPGGDYLISHKDASENDSFSFSMNSSRNFYNRSLASSNSLSFLNTSYNSRSSGTLKFRENQTEDAKNRARDFLDPLKNKQQEDSDFDKPSDSSLKAFELLEVEESEKYAQEPSLGFASTSIDYDTEDFFPATNNRSQSSIPNVSETGEKSSGNSKSKSLAASTSKTRKSIPSKQSVSSSNFIESAKTPTETVKADSLPENNEKTSLVASKLKQDNVTSQKEKGISAKSREKTKANVLKNYTVSSNLSSPTTRSALKRLSAEKIESSLKRKAPVDDAPKPSEIAKNKTSVLKAGANSITSSKGYRNLIHKSSAKETQSDEDHDASNIVSNRQKTKKPKLSKSKKYVSDEEQSEPSLEITEQSYEKSTKSNLSKRFSPKNSKLPLPVNSRVTNTSTAVPISRNPSNFKIKVPQQSSQKEPTNTYDESFSSANALTPAVPRVRVKALPRKPKSRLSNLNMNNLMDSALAPDEDVNSLEDILIPEITPKKTNSKRRGDSDSIKSSTVNALRLKRIPSLRALKSKKVGAGIHNTNNVSAIDVISYELENHINAFEGELIGTKPGLKSSLDKFRSSLRANLTKLDDDFRHRADLNRKLTVQRETQNELRASLLEHRSQSHALEAELHKEKELYQLAQNKKNQLETANQFLNGLDELKHLGSKTNKQTKRTKTDPNITWMGVLADLAIVRARLKLNPLSLDASGTLLSTQKEDLISRLREVDHRR